MKKIYVTEILDKLIEIVSGIDSVVSVSKGDISQLPAPESFKDILPMVLINPGKVHNEWADGNPQSRILNQTYNFNIIYVRYYDIENDDFNDNLDLMVTEGSNLAEMLIEKQTLDDLFIENGNILGSVISDIDFNSNQQKLFKDLEIPASLCTLTMEVYLRSRRM